MAVTVNGVLIDIPARILRDERGGELPLRPQSFDVLCILLENPDRVVTKRELMERVWPDIAVTDDSLVQCIHEIRKVLQDSEHTVIRTAQRQGYRFQQPTGELSLEISRSRLSKNSLLVASFAVIVLVSAGGWLTMLPLNDHDRHPDRPANTSWTVNGKFDRGIVKSTQGSAGAQEEYLLGLHHLNKSGPQNLALAKKHLEKAISLNPSFSDAHAALAKTYAQVSTLAYSRALSINFDDAALRARQALDHVHVRNADVHTVLSQLALRRFQIDEAIAEAEMALSLKPDDTDAMEALARANIFGGEPRRGLELAAEMMRQNPALADRSLLLMGLAEFALENYAQAARDIERGMELGSQDVIYAGILAAAHGLLGNAESSRRAYQVFMEGFGERPDLARQMIVYPFSDPRTAQLLAAGLESAGAKVFFTRDDGGYLRLDTSSRLTGREIGPLLQGSRIEGKGFWCIVSWKRGETEYGLIEYDGNPIHKGIRTDAIGLSSVDGNLLCETWTTERGTRQYCSPVFRVAEGNARKRWGEYVMVTDTGPHPFNLQDSGTGSQSTP